jgi:hypothetical protein
MDQTVRGGAADYNTGFGDSSHESSTLVNTHQIYEQLRLDELEGEIVGLAQRINIGECQFLHAIRAFDLRRGWERYCCNSCAEWLNLKCGIVVATAREKVRTAHALHELPKMSAAFERGQLSYSNVRALTRVATLENERELVAYARDRPATAVEQYCRQLRNVQRSLSLADANLIYENRFLSFSVLPDGGVSISLELPAEEGELVMKAIEHAEAQSSEEQGKARGESLRQRQADALVRVAREYFSTGEATTSASSADQYQVVVHVDESALAGETGKSDLPIETVRRITCDSSLLSVLEDSAGNPLNVGRKKRLVSSAIKRALAARDRHCRYPGCAHKKWLDAHHVTHWIDGGETSVENLILLCSKHHRLLHEGGFRIVAGQQGGIQFRTSKGQVLEMVRECAPRPYVHAVAFG